jgi:hypothetical protein
MAMLDGESVACFPHPCKAIYIPGERSLERSRLENIVSLRNLFKDRTIYLLILLYYRL